MDAFELLRLMALKGLELNLISYNVVINGLCREGRMNETSQMRVRGLRPNERTYTKLIDGFSQQGFLN
ncbi:hypothetical protein Pyn_21521 [Prunus yedoensis var. nudiflora]|uniref:Pentatricopeptide repeat-containing protein n=1 Tax=Prunus yedoensis var. nudiflora TaxID=2094558 RepID=A0A314XHK5_PRUYE|nr:hypothetical protein Pyn_21521 [Prunus yedoensis var. nudiflora]